MYLYRAALSVYKSEVGLKALASQLDSKRVLVDLDHKVANVLASVVSHLQVQVVRVFGRSPERATNTEARGATLSFLRRLKERPRRDGTELVGVVKLILLRLKTTIATAHIQKSSQ